MVKSIRLCASSVVSIALKPYDYDVHGHDVLVEACWCGSLDRRVDIEVLARILEEALKPLDRKPLWATLGYEKAMIEDLLVELSRRLGRVNDLSLCSLTARWSGRSITLNF
mgnify:CR=1 FL=1